MDALKGFFRKYHAVPADDAGPQWDRATDEQLLANTDADCKLWDTRPEVRPGIKSRMAAMANQLLARRQTITMEAALRLTLRINA